MGSISTLRRNKVLIPDLNRETAQTMFSERSQMQKTRHLVIPVVRSVQKKTSLLPKARGGNENDHKKSIRNLLGLVKIF